MILKKNQHYLYLVFQYNAYMSVVHEMIEKVETEHRAKLEQLNSMQQEQRLVCTLVLG